ncbi:MAG: hypothetical protein EON89_15410 [Brevundimonas sp.]|nr:MAG: hypothetical protein EON89_15410 [Brevundimonas sp.]
MSAIRPPAPSPLFPTQTPPSPARASRSDFFRAALEGTGTVAIPKAAETPLPVRTVRTQTPADAPEIFARPGSLLDIRI